MLIIVIINVNDLDLDSVIQCLYLINNLQESLINLFIINCRAGFATECNDFYNKVLCNFKNCTKFPHHQESTGSCPITAVKPGWAKLVLGWETAWEYFVP